MSPEAQRIAIAEACGWYWTGSCYAKSVSGEHWHESAIPDYLNDLNAMHEAQAVLTGDQRANYAGWIEALTDSCVSEGSYDPHGKTNYFQLAKCVSATAAQRAEAFLRTIGKWA